MNYLVTFTRSKKLYSYFLKAFCLIALSNVQYEILAIIRTIEYDTLLKIPKSLNNVKI